MSARIVVANDELVTVRDGMRSLNRMADELASGDREKFVLTRHGQMHAVLLSVDHYATLTARAALTARARAVR